VARFGKWLSVASVVLAGSAVVFFVLLAFVPPGATLIAELSFLAGVLAPALAIVGFALMKASGNRASRVTVFALVLGCVVLVWPLLFFLAFSNCPEGVC
jgi:RsiW-degrading membrane proteinase PrsW (M82 family)